MSADTDNSSVPEKQPARRFRCYRCDEGFETRVVKDSAVCPHCGASVALYRAKIHWATGKAEVRKLASGPKTGEQLDNPTFGSYRDMIDRISFPTGSAPGKASTVGGTNVYYLIGDERRAMSRFIELNRSFVEEQIQSETPSLLQHWFDEHRWTLLLEQYHWEADR